MALNNFASKLVEETYFDWLCEYVGVVTPENEGYLYRNLCEMMFNMEFVPLVSMDENRAEHGIELRELFLREKMGINRVRSPESVISGPCNLLEMLVALCATIADELLYDPDDPTEARFWFLKILENLEIEDYIDPEMTENDAYEVLEKLDNAVNRIYDFSGFGGFFPLKRPKIDQRLVDIWYQMNAWMEENLG